MPTTRVITSVSDDSQKPFEDVEHISNVSNVSSSRSAIKTSKELVNEVDLVDGVTVNENDVLLANNQGQFYPAPLQTVINGATDATQGYYGLLSGFYFSGTATETVIGPNDVDNWVDVELSVDASGLFDNRPTAMKEANPSGHTGTGASGDPIVFSLEGLDMRAFANFRASMSFDPDENEGQLEARLLFNRHSGATPSGDFEIAEVTLSMQSGADRDYLAEPILSFFVGDTIDTNGVGDAGKCRFQIRSDVEGTLDLRALTWYINK